MLQGFGSSAFLPITRECTATPANRWSTVARRCIGCSRSETTKLNRAMSDEDDIPSIGDCCDGKVLVCIGDDEPDQWDDWLEELVDEFNSLRDAATAQGLLCRVGPKCLELGGWSDFCEEVGVDLNQEFWEGSLVSGQFVMGWVEKKKIGTARRRGGSLLKKLQSSLVLQLKAKRIEELKSFKDLEELISRTENDREALLEEVESLKSLRLLRFLGR